MAPTNHIKPAMARFSENVRRKSVGFTKKVNFTPEKKCFKYNFLMILIAHAATFHVKQSDFKDVKLPSSYTWNCMKACQKSIFPRNAVFSKLFRRSCSKIDTI